MFSFISKFLPLFIYPLGLTWILLVLALVLRKKPVWQKAAITLSIVLIWSGGNTWVSSSLKRSLEWQYLPPEEFPKVEVILILSGGTHAAIYPRSTVEVGGAGDRVIYGAYLYHQGVAPYLLVSGGTVPYLGESVPASERMTELLIMLGVPDDAIWKENISRNTYENALYSHEFLQEKDIDRIVLVTSAFHMPRSVMLFEEQGFEVIPGPTDYSITEESWQRLWEPDFLTQVFNFFPTASNLSNTTHSLKEYLGLLVYSLRD
ncbi:MAG: YdcF family protein [Anaerolineales bacterium]|nr:YdcF family protein [Chloroflexota bacterium]MBL6979818.1 YdcF family protein [Anaerolineales bacterium]